MLSGRRCRAYRPTRVAGLESALLAPSTCRNSTLERGQPMPGDNLRFDSDIKPLFREKDRDSMVRVRGFDLWSYDDVRTHAHDILAAVTSGRMPCDGAWPRDQVHTFGSWVESGMAE